jgi:hypothetical protein
VMPVAPFFFSAEFAHFCFAFPFSLLFAPEPSELAVNLEKVEGCTAALHRFGCSVQPTHANAQKRRAARAHVTSNATLADRRAKSDRLHPVLPH